MGARPPGTVSWREVQDEAAERLRLAGFPSPEADARWLVVEASGWEGAQLHVHLDDLVTEKSMVRLDGMLARRLAGEPLQYVVGHWGFRRLDLLVDRRVLIPRPETEGLVDHALAELDRVAPGQGVLVDLGTGSGAIALSVAVERPGAQVVATDVSGGALAVARANLAGVGGAAAARVRLCEGDWFAAVPADLVGTVHVVVSNPPYVASVDPLPAEVSGWEPSEALVPGRTGLESIEAIAAAAPAWLTVEGSLVLEIGDTQGPVAAEIVADAGFRAVRVLQDPAGRDRYLVARLS